MITTDKNKHYDVIVIGGGITGAGTARDCAMRGLRTLLVERFDFAHGATGRNHGLLHSGARYAVTDGESAAECIKENMTLRRIARHCVEETDGLFITLPEDDLSFQSTFVSACHKAGIKAEVIDPEEAKRIEPAVNKDLIGAVRVPDGSVDPFFLTTSNIVDARRHGAEMLTYHEVIGFVYDQARIIGVKMLNRRTGEKKSVYADVTINAAGIWGYHVASLAGVKVNMFPSKGSLLVFGHRVNHMVINRCRKPSDADILVPGDTVCVIGTTSVQVPFETVDDMKATPEEVDLLLREGEKMAPSLASTRVLRAYAGVRPLVARDDDPTGRSISRGIVCLDHETRDGLSGFITISGGKLMTYRQMAETATDMACKKLGNNKPCRTAINPLPGSEAPVETSVHQSFANLAASGRHGTMSEEINKDNIIDDALVCECEGVSVGEVNYAIDNLHVHNLINLRRRTRMGMGTCQGGLCACRAASLMCRDERFADKSLADLADFLNERWKGMMSVGWGDTLCEAQLTATIYQGLCGIDKLATRKEIAE